LLALKLGDQAHPFQAEFTFSREGHQPISFKETMPRTKIATPANASEQGMRGKLSSREL
jgi:hypothetical protein